MIPKKIVQTWETKDISPEFQVIIDTWKNLNPEYEYYLFDKDERYTFIQKHFNSIILETYDLLNPGANKSDFFRYCYLYINGGVTTDLDTLCIGKLNDFVADEFMTSIDLNDNPIEPTHNLALGTVMAAIPGHPIMMNCIRLVVKNVRDRLYPSSRLDLTGPGILGRGVNLYLGNAETESFIGKEGFCKGKYGNMNFLKFEKGTEYFKDMNGNILGQNKNGNRELIRLYENECKRVKQYVSWCGCSTDVFYKPIERKNIVLMCYGQFRNYQDNLVNNLKALEPILKTHNVYVFILSDKGGNYSPENELAIRKILDEFYVNICLFDYVENYDNTEEIETAKKYYSTIKNKNGSSLFSPRLIYREYLLNKLKNEYLDKNQIHTDLTIYCRMFDIMIKPNLSFDEISKQVDMCYHSNILYGSSDTFFIGSSSAIDYLFNLAMKYKNGELYDIWHDSSCVKFILSMDYALTQCKATYSAELQLISHMFYSHFRYINMRVDFTNPHSELNRSCMYHVRLDPRRK